MLSIQQLDRLAGAMVLDRQLSHSFMQNRIGAIEAYNNSYAARYGEQRIELSEEDKQLVLSVLAEDVPGFFTQMLLLLSTLHRDTRTVFADMPARHFREERITGYQLDRVQDSVA